MWCLVITQAALVLAGQLAQVQRVMRGGVVFPGIEEVVEVAGIVEVPQHVAILKVNAVSSFGRFDESGHRTLGQAGMGVGGIWIQRSEIARHAERRKPHPRPLSKREGS